MYLLGRMPHSSIKLWQLKVFPRCRYYVYVTASLYAAKIFATFRLSWYRSQQPGQSFETCQYKPSSDIIQRWNVLISARTGICRRLWSKNSSNNHVANQRHVRRSACQSSDTAEDQSSLQDILACVYLTRCGTRYEMLLLFQEGDFSPTMFRPQRSVQNDVNHFVTLIIRSRLIAGNQETA